VTTPEQKTAAGKEATAADISTYKQQAAHAQHLGVLITSVVNASRA
jgi:hypothetical protein